MPRSAIRRMSRASSIALFAALACSGPEYVDLTAGNLRAIDSLAEQTEAGQTATLLPSGAWLLVGGRNADGTAKAATFILDPRTNQRTIGMNLLEARSRHTATVLPDGSVLVLGGVSREEFVLSAEILEPATQRIRTIAGVEALARSGHTATLLQDGRLLISGGRDSRGICSDTLLWNPATSELTRAPGLEHARQDHRAALLPNGAVLVWGGEDSAGVPVRFAEVFDPQSQRFLRFDEEQRRKLPTEPMQSRLPAAQSAILAVRRAQTDFHPSVLFSKPLDVGTLNPQTVSLVGPSGPVPLTLVPAERGMLLFIHPKTPLAPATDYTVFVRGARDEHGHVLGFAAVHLRTPPISVTDQVGDSGLPKPSPSFPVASATGPLPAGNFGYVDMTKLRWKPGRRVANDDEVWIPGLEHLSGNWWNKLPETDGSQPPQAPSGVTALAGRVLRMNGRPLAGVALRSGDKQVTTDAKGFFLLKGLAAGFARMDIDGRTANGETARYGTYAVRVELKAGVTTNLPYVIWMPKLDPQGTVRIPSPTTEETVVSTPSIPGLELHIPAGTVIRDREGKIVTELNLTAIPVNQPPFPLPDLSVPVYFTIQPGGAVLEGFAPEARGARLFYPNFRREVPGARGVFWNYDANDRGWFIYGLGTISRDAQQAIPDPGVVITEFSGAMFNGGGAPPGDPGPPGCGPAGSGPGGGGDGSGGDSGAGPPGSNDCGDPVSLFSGQFTRTETDLVLPDVIPINITRTYRSFDLNRRMFGVGMTLNQDMFFYSLNQYQETDLILPSGSRVHFVRISPGTNYTDAVFTTQAPGQWYGAMVSWNGNGWDLKFKDGAIWKFGVESPITQMSDRFGNKMIFTRTSPTAPISRIDSPNGRWVEFTFDTSYRVTSLKDNAGRMVSYTYDANGRLTSVTNPNGETRAYEYNVDNVLSRVRSAKGDVVVENTYGWAPSGFAQCVFKQTLADGSTFNIRPAAPCSATPPAPPPPSSPPRVAEVTDRQGSIRHVEYDAQRHIVTDTFPMGTPEEQITTFSYDPATTLLASMTDALNRTTSYAYDAQGNMTSVTRLTGTPSATTTTYTYGPLGRVTGITDPLLHTTQFTYDSSGNLVETRDPLGHSKTMTYDLQGRMISMTSALQQPVAFNYTGPDLTSITDSLGRITTLIYDGSGRTRAVVNQLGQRTVYSYDAAGRQTKVVDPMGNSITYAYDANGNRVSSTDQRGNTTTYVYDALNRQLSHTDPLNNSETVFYTPGGLLAQMVDRKGQLSQFTYDSRGRLVSQGFGATVIAPTAFESNVIYTYDKADRLTIIADSTGGEIHYAYDGLDRVIQEATVLGSVSYDYDAADRRTVMTATQQSSVYYTYDDGGKLVQVSQGADSVRLTYDGANRYSSVQLRNGVTINYAYDAGGQLTSITYDSRSNRLGDLQYSYDGLGREIRRSGSLARVDLPMAMSAASYNSNNQIALWNGSAYQYDLNGNLTSDGTRGFRWNARNELIEIDSAPGVIVGQFSYDALGRRTRKVVGGVATQFLYDGTNYIEELTDEASPVLKATILTGLGIDDAFGRTSEANNKTDYLTDRLQSTIGLTDGSGNIVTTYSYEAYGRSTRSGSPDVNARGFTGREDDGTTGLIYLRARYYDPTTGRMLGEDPLGIAGGSLNLYTYALGDPLNLTDRTGLSARADTCAEAMSEARTAAKQLEEIGEYFRSFGCLNRGHKKKAEQLKNRLQRAINTVDRYCPNPVTDETFRWTLLLIVLYPQIECAPVCH